MNNRLIKSNDAGGGACTNTVDLYNPFPDGGGLALYQLNGDATDVSGNYDGTWVGTPSYGTGEFGQAATFNGSNQGISLPSLTNSYPFTVSAWINTSYFPNPDFSPIVQQNINGQRVTIAATSVWGANQIAIAFGGTSQFSTDANSITSNQWTQITACFRASTDFDFYINGSAANVTNNGGNHGGTAANAIGYNGVSTEWFNGSIDQVRIFSRALRPYEVEALYTEEYCTPTIVPSEHFNTVLWTGDGSTGRQITGVGFQPDLVWTKGRNNASWAHFLQDSVRGATKFLKSNTTDAEGTTSPNLVESFDTDGFTINANGNTNNSGDTYVAWNFKAGGAAVTNTDGTITSQVSANTEAGFSIVSYTGSGSSGMTVGHGLTITPKIVIIKNRTSGGDAYAWQVFGGLLFERLVLNDTVADQNNFGCTFSDTTFQTTQTSPQQGNPAWNGSSQDYIAYCFAEVEGFSSFGSYVGNGSTSGTTVVTGFEPAFVMIKGTDQVSDWIMLDNKRDTTNPNSARLDANSSDAEFTGENLVNFLENGFELATASASKNGNGKKFIYMAFAADPTAVEPTLEDSFNTVLYTGNGSTQSVTGVGFQPDFTWIKNRNTSNYHHLFDTVRGAQRRIYSNSTDSENNSTTTLTAFGSDGFTVSSDVDVNGNGNNLVAWNWKGAEIPAINSNGSIPSVVSANPAAGFSIVSYTGNGVNATIGHGLGEAPKVLIIKNRDEVENWAVGHEYMSATPWNNNMLFLNATNSVYTSIPAWGNQSPTSTTFGVGANLLTNSSGKNHIAYCFAEVAGFSKFGSYTGNGNAAGPTINCGFEPAFVMIKASSDVGLWAMHDNKRSNYSGSIYARLQAEDSAAEYDGYPTDKYVEFSPTGFQVTNTSNSWNGSGRTYIYMAFANQF